MSADGIGIEYFARAPFPLQVELVIDVQKELLNEAHSNLHNSGATSCGALAATKWRAGEKWNHLFKMCVKIPQEILFTSFGHSRLNTQGNMLASPSSKRFLIKGNSGFDWARGPRRGEPWNQSLLTGGGGKKDTILGVKGVTGKLNFLPLISHNTLNFRNEFIRACLLQVFPCVQLLAVTACPLRQGVLLLPRWPRQPAQCRETG